MSILNLTHDKLNLKYLKCDHYICDDMSVKHSEKNYRKAKPKEKKEICNHPCFGYTQIHLGKNPILIVTTPVMKCLFGIRQSHGDNFAMNLQFSNLVEDLEMQSFYEFIEKLELLLMKQMGLEEENNVFISQIKHDKKGKYEPNLSVKVPFQYNKFQTDIYSDHSSFVSLLNIQSFTMMKCDIYLDKLWKINDTFHCKWKCKAIHLV